MNSFRQGFDTCLRNAMRSLLCLLLLAGLTARPQDAIALAAENSGLVQPVPPCGVIDWSAMRLQATGQGFASGQEATTPRGRRMAERAAVLDARRNLVEVFASVRIDSRTLVRDFLVESDIAANQLAGVLLQNQHEQRRDLPDGGVEVTVSASLRGETARLLWTIAPPVPNHLDRQAIEQNLQNLQQQSRAATAQSATPQNSPGHSGLIVDARGLDFSPSLRPDVYGPRSRLYPPAGMSPDLMAQQGYVAYFPTLELALASKRAGQNPLVLAAASLNEEQRSSLRVDAQGARALRQLLAQPQNPLLRGAVAIVY